ncbi:hypothetical protein MUG91_G126n16 [Manis pentadactyla]|nr:hypothetical protein MUG91_G126n16 [Manis pentadactyla]
MPDDLECGRESGQKASPGWWLGCTRMRNIGRMRRLCEWWLRPGRWLTAQEPAGNLGGFQLTQRYRTEECVLPRHLSSPPERDRSCPEGRMLAPCPL